MIRISSPTDRNHRLADFGLVAMKARSFGVWAARFAPRAALLSAQAHAGEVVEGYGQAPSGYETAGSAKSGRFMTSTAELLRSGPTEGREGGLRSPL